MHQWTLPKQRPCLEFSFRTEIWIISGGWDKNHCIFLFVRDTFWKGTSSFKKVLLFIQKSLIIYITRLEANKIFEIETVKELWTRTKGKAPTLPQTGFLGSISGKTFWNIQAPPLSQGFPLPTKWWVPGKWFQQWHHYCIDRDKIPLTPPLHPRQLFPSAQAHNGEGTAA